MQSDCKYLEQSLNGKWISLARQWLSEHGPVTTEQYMTSVRPIMPSHITFGKIRKSQSFLARRALRIVAVQQEDGHWIVKPLNRKKTGATDEMRRILSLHNTVTFEEIRHIKNFAGVLDNLLRRGEVIRVSKGVYQAAGKVQNE